MLTASDESCKVSPEAHALDALSAALNKKVPAVLADQQLMSVMVSDVPPLVQLGVLLSARAPDAAVENVAATRVVEPALTEVVAAVPGAAV